MEKYIVTEEQLKRLEKVHILLAREIRQNTIIRSICDSVDTAVHLGEIAKKLVEENTLDYEIPVEGGKFVFIPNKKP